MSLPNRVKYLEIESAFEVLKKAEALKSLGHKIVNLGIGQPDFIPPKHVIDRAIKTLKDDQHGYTNSKGILELRNAISLKIKNKHKAHVDPNQILITPGGKVIIYLSIMILAEENCEVLIPNPSFPIYRSIANYSGAKTITFNLKEENNFSFIANELIKKITPKTRLIILNSPSNPTGGIYKESEIKKLINAIADIPNLYILSDEIYSDIIFKKNKNVSLLQYEKIKKKLIVLDGLSKNFAMTGWRIGWGIFPETLMNHAEKLAVNIYSCVNVFTQYAAIEAIEGSQKIVDDRKNIFFNRSKLMTKLLNQIDGFSCLQPQGAFYCFPNITKTGLTSDILQNRLLDEAGVATISGSSFGKYGDGYLRLSCANSEKNINLAMNKIKYWVSQNKSHFIL